MWRIRFHFVCRYKKPCNLLTFMALHTYNLLPGLGLPGDPDGAPAAAKVLKCKYVSCDQNEPSNVKLIFARMMILWSLERPQEPWQDRYKTAEASKSTRAHELLLLKGYPLLVVLL